MKSNKLYWMLMAVLLCGLSVTVTSCKDDDDESEKSEEQLEQDAQVMTEERDAFWGVVGQLTDAVALPENWKDVTFEPSYGVADEDNALQRIVVVIGTAEAARLFGNIIGDNSVVTEDTPEYTFSDNNVGTLRYLRSTDSRSIASVDVNIRQMPHLQKIVFKTPQQLGTNTLFNGSFDGSAYYRFGDVVKKNNKDGKSEYWICVRPAFSYEGKGDSHWITLSGLPEDNLFHHKGSNGIDYYLPKNLDDNSTHEQNFAEMLYAILNPAQWEQNVTNNRKLDMFNGFSRDYIDYHNSWFWTMVSQGWDEARILDRCFGGMTMDQLRQSIAADGLTVLYDGYSWYTSISWSPTLYGRTYSGANLKTAKKVKWSKKVKDGIELDFRDSYWRAFERNKGFFGDSKPRWVIRHATGKQLGGHDDPKRALDGVEEIYVYNHFFIANKNYVEDDDIINDYSGSGHGYYVAGDVVKDVNGNRWVCVQSRLEEQHLSYFISFDPGAIGSADNRFANLPSRNLALQMLYQLTSYFTNYVKDRSQGPQGFMYESIRDNCEVDIEQYLAAHGFMAEGHPGLVKVYCGNALFKDEDNQVCIARYVYDLAALQPNGGRDMRVFTFDQYMEGPARKMYLTDLFNQNFVSQYNNDPKWGFKPWIKTPYMGDVDCQFVLYTQRLAPVTETDLQKWYCQRGFEYQRDATDQKAGFNMYREPVMTFAVKRVVDNGTVNTHFDDGTRILQYKSMLAEKEDFYTNFMDPGVLAYPGMVTNAIYINDQLGGFGITNAR